MVGYNQIEISLMAYTDSITSLANVTGIGTRRTEAPRVDGRVMPSIDVAFSFTASAQPTTGKDLQRLPEGRDVSELITIYTKTEIKMEAPDAGLLADLITIRGRTYEVQHVEPWDAFGFAYWKAVGLAVV